MNIGTNKLPLRLVFYELDDDINVISDYSI